MPTLVEYNLPILEKNPPIPIETILYSDFEKSNTKYDIIFQYSSIEHSGLGRYGDNIDPDGDIKTMDQIKKHLIDNGYLFWASPVNGIDYLGWNVHRVYGPIRLPILFNGFKEILWTPKSKENIMNNKKKDSLIIGQSLVILQKQI